jgi:hypothetical protein
VLGWFIGAARQANRNEKLIHHSLLRHFQGVRKERTTYCPEHTIVYLNIPSALKPVKHENSLPIRKLPQQWTLHEEELTIISPVDESEPSCSDVVPDFPELTVPPSYIAV